MVNTMTNDRAIAMLKCADLAWWASFCAALLFALVMTQREPELILPPFWLFAGVVIVWGVVGWQVQNALQKRLGDDAFFARGKKVAAGFIIALIFGLAVLDWNWFVVALPGLAVSLFVSLALDRAIVVLKFASLAWWASCCAGFLFAFMTTRQEPELILPPFWLFAGVVIVWGVAGCQVENALQKRMGDDASGWRKKIGLGFIAALFFGLAALDWDFFVFALPGMAVAFFASTALMVVPTVLKKRMAADAYAKFIRIYPWVAIIIVFAVIDLLPEYLDF